jgi:hypothetical protein
MTFECEDGVIPNHPFAVVGNSQEASPAGLNVYHDALRSGVNRILDQFFCNRSRSLDNFAGGNLVGNVIWKDADYGH